MRIPNAPVNSPAGYIIFNSVIGLHSIYEQAYSSINDALPNVLADVGKLVEQFSPIMSVSTIAAFTAMSEHI